MVLFSFLEVFKCVNIRDTIKGLIWLKINHHISCRIVDVYDFGDSGGVYLSI
jgi:hypothetical protein